MRWKSTLIRIAALSAIVTASAARAQQGQVTSLKVYGASLEGNLLGDSPDRDVLVYLPPSYEQEPDRRYPVLYLLHGYCAQCDGSLYSWWFDSDSYTGHAGRILEQLLTEDRAVEMILVAPDVDNGYRGAWYANSVTTGNWTDYVARDLVQYVDANYRTLADRTHRGVAGHSMGGDGALYVAFENPDVFGAVYSMAPGPAGYTPERGLGGASWSAQWRVLLDAIAAGVTEFSELPGETQFHVTFGATAAPNPDNPPFFIDYLYEDVGGELRLVDSVWQRWHARDPAVMAHVLADRVRQLDAIYLDVGRRDELLPDARAVSQSLRDEGSPTSSRNSSATT